MTPPVPITERKLNRSTRTLRRQIETAHRRNAELRATIAEKNREILSLQWKLRWKDLKALAKQAS